MSTHSGAAAIANASRAVSNGNWSAGYKIGQRDARPLLVQEDGGARGGCNSAASES